jgi:hypothetical protein
MRVCFRSCAEGCCCYDGGLANPRDVCRSGFARVEAVALLFIMLVMAALLLASGSYERRTAMLNRDLANLRRIGAWTFAYANDFEDRHPSLLSAPDSIWPDIRATAKSSPLQQAVGHAIDIVRRRTGRHTLPLPGGWIPHVLYTHLILADYAQRELPDTTFVSTGDKYRLNWLDDPINKHDNGFWQPFQNPESGPVPGSSKRWPYSASFQTPPAWYDKSETGSRLSQNSTRSYLLPGGAVLGGHVLSDVAFPAQKVMVHDYGARHFSQQVQYFAAKTSRVVVLMGDGGASPRLTGDANEGWEPNIPTVARVASLTYSPRTWEPPTSNGTSAEQVWGHYRWTRGGIRGRDFDGPEIDTGQK